jgi:gamma-glutamyltranspeptidase/glutathione hydrolase
MFLRLFRPYDAPLVRGVFVICLSLLLVACSRQPPVAAVASAHPLATEAGLAILERGGNAFDAAVAVTAMLGVVEPYGSGLGGGGFYLLHRQRDQFQVMLDARETAPAAAHRDMYLDEQGNVIDGASINGPLAAAIPGVPAALAHLARDYGRLPLKETLAPAMRVAREGFSVDERYRRYLNFRLEVMHRYPAAAAVFMAFDSVPAPGSVIRQPDLADTLERISVAGHAGFYQGELAQKLVQGVQAAGGSWTLQDLADYRVIERQPIVMEYRGAKIISAAPPSSGGVALATMFNILAGYDLAQLDGVTRKHVLVEAMRRAYRDRAEYLGDPDQVQIPLARLLSRSHADQLRSSISLEDATPSHSLPPAAGSQGQGNNTTHFSILDHQGNRVAATLSLNFPFGSCFMAPGTGVILNDEMDDFSAKPGVPNVYGLVGAQANAIAPGKRPLSSMSPTFVETGDKIAILGTPGGSRIITMVLHGALGVLAGDNAEQIVSAPRFHHQYLPDRISREAGAISEDEETELALMGHILEPQPDDTRTYGNMQLLIWDMSNNQVQAASDPRGSGTARTSR